MIDQPVYQSTKTTILIIDDEDYLADLIASALASEGYDTRVAYSGLDGIASAQQTHTDLIILDLMMPHMDGKEVATQLRAMDSTRGIPIILTSAGTRPRQFFADVTFVSKPFNITHMLREVELRLQVA